MNELFHSSVAPTENSLKLVSYLQNIFCLFASTSIERFTCQQNPKVDRNVIAETCLTRQNACDIRVIIAAYSTFL